MIWNHLTDDTVINSSEGAFASILLAKRYHTRTYLVPGLCRSALHLPSTSTRVPEPLSSTSATLQHTSRVPSVLIGASNSKYCSPCNIWQHSNNKGPLSVNKNYVLTQQVPCPIIGTTVRCTCFTNQFLAEKSA